MAMPTSTESLAIAPPALDVAALDAARDAVHGGAVAAGNQVWRQEFVELLNKALATELTRVLRYKRHHFIARTCAAPPIVEAFAVHAAEGLIHADRLACRIVQLGGDPDFCPDTLSTRSHAHYDDQRALLAMVHADLRAERLAIEGYRQLVRLVGERDPCTRELFEDILADEQCHVDELEAWLHGQDGSIR